MRHPVAIEIIEMFNEIETKGLEDEEFIAAVRAIADKAAAYKDELPQFPPDFVESIRKAMDEHEQIVLRSKDLDRRSAIADENRAIAQANFDRIADQLLSIPPEKPKGN